MLFRRLSHSGGEIISQRLLITDVEIVEETSLYEAVIFPGETLNEVEDTLKYDFFASEGGLYLGPWKIKIRNLEMYLCTEPILVGVFEYFGKKYPDDVWTFYYKDRMIDHPTEEELLNFLWGDYEPK